MATTNRWGRAIAAGVLSELLIIISIMVAIVVLKKMTGPTFQSMVMAHRIATWVELIGGPIVVFLFTRWVVRPIPSLHMAHALTVVGLAVAGQLSIFIQTVREGHAPFWIVALAVVLKVAAAVWAAELARRR